MNLLLIERVKYMKAFKSRPLQVLFTGSLIGCSAMAQTPSLGSLEVDLVKHNTIQDLRSLSNTQSLTGNITGGGGDVVICYESASVKEEVEKAIQSSKNKVDLQLDKKRPGYPQSVDLYDALQVRGRDTRIQPAVKWHSVRELYDNLEKTDSDLTEIFTPIAESDWVQYDNGLLEVYDHNFNGRDEAECLLVQAAYYDSDELEVQYDPRIFYAMEKAHQNALIIHEDFYRFYREQVVLRNQQLERLASGLSTHPAMSYVMGPEEARKYKIETVTSDPVRPWVGFLMTNYLYPYNKYQKRLKKIAVGIKMAFGAYQKGATRSQLANVKVHLEMAYPRFSPKTREEYRLALSVSRIK